MDRTPACSTHQNQPQSSLRRFLKDIRPGRQVFCQDPPASSVCMWNPGELAATLLWHPQRKSSCKSICLQQFITQFHFYVPCALGTRLDNQVLPEKRSHDPAVFGPIEGRPPFAVDASLTQTEHVCTYIS